MSRTQLMILVLLLFLTTLATLTVGASRASDNGDSRAGELIFAGSDFSGGTTERLLISDDGLILEPGAASGTYTSPVWEAPLPYNALVPEWTAEAPEGRAVVVEVRTGTGGAWDAWITLRENADLTDPESEAVTGDMIMTPGTGTTHSQVQVRVRLSRVSDVAEPILQSIHLYFIDSTDGPTSEELLAEQQSLGQPETTGDGYPKPSVISREVWCNPNYGDAYEECEYTEGLRYYPVSHLIVHHTVTRELSDGDSAEIVRAIWRYHTFSKEWGDIGYNYLVDVNGVIYEGHLGGDDVVGTHAGDANRGTMAVALIGNFEDSVPPPAMIDAVGDLLAWKADEKDIDVFDSGYLPDMGWGLPHLMGHRDVYGTTACPGHYAHGLLPLLRDGVADRIGFESPYVYYDEARPETNFSRSDENWLTGPRSCGIDGHAYYTWSVTDRAESTDWAEWQPELPLPGLYELHVYAPYCRTGERDTNGAVYEVTHARGTDTVVVDQEENLGVWVSLGEYEFEAGTSGRLRLTDLTSTDEDWGVWADAIRVYYEDPSAVDRAPADGTWLPGQQVNFQWDIQNRPLLESQTLQAARDEAFTDLVLSTTLPSTANAYTETFADTNIDLYWRLQLQSTRGATLDGPPLTFGLDTEPPASSIDRIYRLDGDRYLVSWSGQDAGSGIVSYNIEYRMSGESGWTSLPIPAGATSRIFAPPMPGQTYWFRSQASDAVGHTESVEGNDGDLNTGNAIILTQKAMIPLTLKEAETIDDPG